MANRGCTIVIKILGGSTGNGDVEDMSLPVALHSPLQVLREQLMDIVGIPVQDQVLILCNLSDPDRNSDVLLSGRDFDTLRACGIRNGSTLTLHALGISAELKQHLTKQAMSSGKISSKDPSEKPRLSLSTPIGAADADHSYNGVIFDVVSPGPFEVNLMSISIAGMLGRVRIYARDCPWEDDKPRKGPSPHWWAHRESVSPQGWELIADRTCRPSWDKPLEIHFDKPVKLLPHTCRALYCHSGLPDDLGIQYQSYKKNDIVASDAHIEIRPGLGHTGSEPFDEQHGWYRAHRGPAGSVAYTVTRKGWTPFEHAIFPTPLRRAVLSMLQCQNHDNYLASTLVSSSSSGAIPAKSTVTRDSSSSSAPLQKAEEEGQVLKMSADDPSFTTSSVSHSRVESPLIVAPSGRLPQRTAVPTRQEQCYASMAQLLNVCKGRRISALPKFVIYHILEFMHWDWFEECYKDEWDAEPFNPTKSIAKKSAARRERSSRGVMSALGLDTAQGSPSQLNALHQLLMQVGWMHGGGSAVMAAEDADMFGSDDDDDDSDYGEEEDEEDDEEEGDEEGEWEEEGEWVEDDSDDEAMMEHVLGGIEQEEEEDSDEEKDGDEEDMEGDSGADSHDADDSGDESGENGSSDSAMDVSSRQRSDSGEDASAMEDHASSGNEEDGSHGNDDGGDDSADYQSADGSDSGGAGGEADWDSEED